jgi:hypothetical protein
MNVGRNRTLDLVVLLFVKSVVIYGFRQCLDSGYGVVWICHACGKGVDECVIQMVVMVVSVRLVQGVLKQQQERVYLFRIRKKAGILLKELSLFGRDTLLY